MYKYSIFNLHKFSMIFLSHFAAFSIFRQIMLSTGPLAPHLGYPLALCCIHYEAGRAPRRRSAILAEKGDFHA